MLSCKDMGLKILEYLQKVLILCIFYTYVKADFILSEKLKDVVDNPITEENILPYLQKIQSNPEYLSTFWGNQIVFGGMALKNGHFTSANEQWQKALSVCLPENLNLILLKNLCLLHKNNIKTDEQLLLYEKYAEAYPNEPDVPRIHIALGYNYLMRHVFERALYHFYHVLNGVMGIKDKNVTVYETYVVWAQLGIAQTYLEQQKYEEAFNFFSKIHFEDNDESLMADVMLKKGLCAYYTQNWDDAIACLKTFCENGANRSNGPEGYYYLIHSFKNKDDKDNVVTTVFKLLKISQQKRIQKEENWEIWDRYQKKITTEVAQDFYEKGDLMDAIKIYQALVDLNTTPEWQWPILCQLGLCYERLGLPLRSKAAYKLIADAKDQWNETDIQWTEDLRNYHLQATWHLEQINAYEKIKMDMENLLKTAP